MNASKTVHSVPKAPLVVVVFNRPDHAARLRERLRPEGSRPLYLVSDGPRVNRPGEAAQVQQCTALFSDWPGPLHRISSPRNLGCKARISSALTVVFRQVDRAIILEDDCLPDPAFFLFADQALEAYSSDPRVLSVCGTKTFPGEVGDRDVYFSRYNNCWGWATWSRAWALYDDSFTSRSRLGIAAAIRDYLGSTRAAVYWSYLLFKVLRGDIRSWAYCWMISSFLNEGLHIYPAHNLVINSGFGPDATHTRSAAPYMPQRYGVMRSHLAFPPTERPLDEADRWIEDHMYSKSLRVRLRWLLLKMKST